MQHVLLPACCVLSCSAGSLPWGIKAQRGTWQPGLLPAADAQTRGTASHGLWIAGKLFLPVDQVTDHRIRAKQYARQDGD